jgi:hypothetical protein
MERHLLIVHARKASMYRLFMFAAFCILFSSYHWCLRLLGFGCLYFVANSEWPIMQRVRRGVLALFTDESVHRSSARVHAFMAGAIAVWLGAWLSWFNGLVVIVTLPFIMIEAEHLISYALGGSSEDARGLKWITLGFVCTTSAIAVYAAWYSWLAVTFVSFLLFPILSCLGVAGVSFAVSLVLYGVAYGQQFGSLAVDGLAQLSKLPYWLANLVTVGIAMLMVWLSWSSWFWMCISGPLLLCLLPATATELLSLGVQKTGGAVISDYWFGSVINQSATIALNGLLIACVLGITFGFTAGQKCYSCCCCKSKGGEEDEAPPSTAT